MSHYLKHQRDKRKTQTILSAVIRLNQLLPFFGYSVFSQSLIVAHTFLVFEEALIFDTWVVPLWHFMTLA